MKRPKLRERLVTLEHKVESLIDKRKPEEQLLLLLDAGRGSYDKASYEAAEKVLSRYCHQNGIDENDHDVMVKHIQQNPEVSPFAVSYAGAYQTILSRLGGLNDPAP